MTVRRQIDFPKKMTELPPEAVQDGVNRALSEDLRSAGDITSIALFPPESRAVRGRLTAKAPGVLCGCSLARAVYRRIDPNVRIRFLKDDGDSVRAGDAIFEVEGKPLAVLSGERTALNFIGLLSGIATRTRELARSVSKYPVKLLDTRKTLPGLREFQKYAVSVGGGFNHRYGLYDMILIKENHVKAAGGVQPAVAKARRNFPDIPIEVEVETPEEVRDALETDADILMLDNMTNAQVRQAVKTVAGRKYLEVSGNVDGKRLVELAKTGVDFVSMGSLTHTVQNLDISFRLF